MKTLLGAPTRPFPLALVLATLLLVSLCNASRARAQVDRPLPPDSSGEPSPGPSLPEASPATPESPADSSTPPPDAPGQPEGAPPPPEASALPPTGSAAPVPPAATAAASTVAVRRQANGAPLSLTFFGFVELDAIYDSTQSFADAPGNSPIGRSGTYIGEHDRTTFSARASRIGLRLEGPQSDLARSSAIMEMDFLGNQSAGASEASLFTDSIFRIRHMALKIETPGIDFLAGQYWQLFGWQSYFHPSTVAIQGIPGQVYSRAPQIRLSRAFKTDAVTVEVAVAAARPPQRNSARPDFQGGMRLLINDWKGVHTAGATETTVDAGGIGVSAVYRRFRVTEFTAEPIIARSKSAGGVSIDVLVPVVPVSSDGSRANALTFNGSYVRGTGISDLYAGLTGGIAFPSLPNPSVATPAPMYVPDVDPGLVVYAPGGGLHTIDWQSFTIGFQYYLPPAGNVWISGNYTQIQSRNIAEYAVGIQNRVFDRSRWADGNLFWNVNRAIRFGAAFARAQQRYADQELATNYRLQFSAFYMF